MYEAFVGWAKTVDWQAWATFANAGAILFAAVVARQTFKNWRKQHHYQRRAALAEEVLIAFEKAEKALDDVRSPISTSSEIEHAKAALGDNAENGFRITAQVTANRIADRLPIWDKVSDLLAPTRVNFGEGAANALRGVLRAAHEVRTAANFYGRQRGQDEFLYRMEAKIWAESEMIDGEVSDTLKSRIVACRHQLEEKLDKYLSDND